MCVLLPRGRLSDQGLGRETLAPYPARDFGHQAQLVALDGFRYRIALPYRSEAALGRKPDLFAREKAARLLDPAYDFPGRLERGALGRDEAEHDALVGRDVAQRLERSRSPVVVLQEPEREIAGPPEGLTRDGLVASLADIVAPVVAAAQMETEGDAGNLGDRVW
jgi:hypothetical protein